MTCIFTGIQLDDEAMVNITDPDEASILRNELDSEQGRGIFCLLSF